MGAINQANYWHSELASIATALDRRGESQFAMRVNDAANALLALTPAGPVLNWIPVTERLPTKEEYGAYPHVLVTVEYAKHPEYGQGIQIAELRFIGGNLDRPYWVTPGKTVSNRWKTNIASSPTGPTST